MKKHKRKNKIIFLKVAIVALEAVAIGLIIYLIVLPMYPPLKYRLAYNEIGNITDAKDKEVLKEKTEEIKEEIKKEANSRLPQAKYSVSPNRIIIPKIGVNAPVVESQSAEYGLSRGSWRVPESSTPDKGGNTVITGHRFKYLPPNNLTFYLLDKMEKGDVFSVIWNEKDYYYRVREVKIVDRTEVSIQDQTEEPIVTLFTCHPIYSTTQRLVVVGELID